MPTCLQRDLATGRFPVTLEITPPQQPSTRVLFRRARALAPVATVVNVIQRPDRVSSLEASRVLRQAGLDPVLHVVNRGRPRAAIRAELALATKHGIGALLCMRGDHAGSDRSDTPCLRETIALARSLQPHALVGATLNPYARRDRVFANLWPKLEAGATFVQTQPIFEPSRLAPFVATLKDRSPETRLVPMVMPLFSFEAARRVEKRLRIRLPSRLLEDLRRGAVAAGWSWLEDTLVALAETEGVDGLTVTTPMMDVPGVLARRLATSLERVRVDRLARDGLSAADPR